MDTTYKYFAFISYSRKDSRAAAFIHRSLEHFRIPTRFVEPQYRPDKGRFLRPIFRDKRDLANTEGSFTEGIRSALEATRYLFVVCSRNAAESLWVNEEIKYFLAHNGDDLQKVVPIVLEGNPGAGDETECLPTALRCKEITFRNLPTMIPDEGAKESEGWENGVIQALSYVLHVGREKIKASIDAERVRQMKIYAAIGVVCTVIFAGLALWAVRAERRAEVNRRIAEANEQRAVQGEAEARLQRDRAEKNEQRALAGEREAKEQRSRAEKNEQRALAGERDAKAKKELSEKTLGFVQKMLQEGKPDEHGPKNVVDLLSEQISKVDLLTPDELRYSVAALLGGIMQEQSMMKPAERLLSGAVNYYRRQKDEVKFNECANSLAVLYSMSGRGREAIALQEEIGRTSAMTNYSPIVHVRHLQNIGDAYYNMGDGESAYKYYMLAKDKLQSKECREMACLLVDEALYREAKGDLQNAEMLLRRAVDMHQKVTGQDNADFLEKCGRVCYQRRKYDDARQFVERAVALLRNRGLEKSSMMAMSQNTLGLICDAEGKLQEAISLWEKAIAILEGAGRGNDGLLVNMYGNLGMAFTKLGNRTRARHLLAKGISIGEKQYGSDSEMLFFCLVNLGFVEMQAKDYSRAIAYLNRAASVIVRKYGNNHPNLINVYNNITTMNVNRHEFPAALASGEEAVRLCETNHLIETDSGAIALCNLAQANEELGNHECAVAQITQARDIARRVIRANDQNRWSCEVTYEGIVSGFANKEKVKELLLDKETVKKAAKKALDEKRYDEARDLYEKLLRLLRERGEEMTADQQLAYNQLGVISADAEEDYRSAFAHYRKAIEIGERLYGAKSPDLAINYHNAGYCLGKAGDSRGAVEYYRKAVDARRAAAQPDKKELSDLYTKLARAYEEFGDHSNAVESCRFALDCDFDVYGTNSVAVAVDYEDLANFQLKQGENELAAANYENALRIRERTGADPKKLSYLTNQIGIGLERTGKIAQALEWHRRSYRLDLELNGLTNRNTVVSLANIGDCERKCGDVTNAVRHLSQALELKLKIPEFSDKDLSLAYNDLGLAYDDVGDYENAIKSYKQALAIDVRLHGRQHREVMVVYGNMAITYRKMNRAKDESSCLRKTLDIALALDEGGREAGQVVLTRYRELADYLSRQEDYVRCTEVRKRIVELTERIHGAESPMVAKECNLCGNANWNAGAYAEAEVFYQRSLELYRCAGTNFAMSVAAVAGNLGRNEIKLGKYNEALETLGIALAIYRDRGFEGKSDLAKIEADVAECREWQAAIPVVMIEKITEGDVADRIGLRKGDVWCEIGKWKLADYVNGKNAFWKKAQEEWDRLKETNRIFSVLRNETNGWEKLSFRLDKSSLGFVYALKPMPREKFSQISSQFAPGRTSK